MRKLVLFVVVATLTSGCAGISLAQIIQPPTFRQAPGQPAEIRLVGPSGGTPFGGAAVRVWLEVENPNPFGFTLSTVNATLSLQGSRAATGEFPLGLPLQARQRNVVPIDLAISFSDIPALAGSLRQLAIGGSVPYELDGTVGVDAGRFGAPTFGPMRLTTGELRVTR